MKRILIVVAAVAGLFVAFGSQAEAGWGHSRYGYGSGWGGYGYGSGYGGYGYGRGYGYGYPRWHDTSHYHYYPGTFYRHGDHYHYHPGHWDLHRSGHWHY